MIFIIFFGEAKTQPAFNPGKLMTVPLIILAVLSVVGGFVELPGSIGMLLGVIGILYGAKLAFAHTDFKRLVAYTSVSHYVLIVNCR